MTTQSISIRFSQNDRSYEIDLTLNKGWTFRGPDDTRNWWSNYITQFFKEHADLTPKDLRSIDENGIALADGRVFTHPEIFKLNYGPALTTAQKTQLVWETLPALKINPEKEIPPIEPIASVNLPEKPLTVEKMAEVEYEFLDPQEHSHVLDEIPRTPRWSTPEGLTPPSRSELVLRESAYLAMTQGKTFNPMKKGASNETVQGINLSMDERRNYKMKITLLDHLKRFFGVESFESTEVFAKNSPLNGVRTLLGQIWNAITSSFNRFADTTTLLRKVEDEHGVSESYAGRASSPETAREIAEFVFLGEIDNFENHSGLSKGIRYNDQTQTYELTFAVQSFLNMNILAGKDQRNMFDLEAKLYQQLAELPDGLTMIHPRTKKQYTVKVQPIPLFANQFNSFNHVEKVLPKKFSGEEKALKETAKADAILEKIADAKIVDLKKQAENKAISEEDLREIHEQIRQIEDAFASLKNKSLKKPWEQILTRAFICHLLELPEFIHCKSSCDRTGGVGIPMVVAMKQWLKAGKKVPKVNGHFSIVAIVGHKETVRVGGKETVFEPFKELFLYKMLHELKISEISRGPKGFKIKEMGLFHPALSDLLPERCLKRGIFFDDPHLDKSGMGRDLVMDLGSVRV